MTTTPRGAPELASAQAVPEVTVNEQIRHTEAGAGHFIVADNDLTAPPGSCADGASYIIAATATGAWAGKENYVATAQGTNAAGGWLYHSPVEGYTAYIQDENARHLCDGSAWALDSSGGTTTASTTEQLTGTDTAKASTPDSVAALWEQGSDVASSGTISLGEGGYFNITGTTTITDVDFATDKAGRKAWVKFAGALTLTHNATTLILPAAANITTAAGDTACFVSEGSDVVRCVAYNRASGIPLNLADSSAQGDVLYRDASGWVRLAAGVSGQVLKTQGAGANPVWGAATSGGGGLSLAWTQVANTNLPAPVANYDVTGLGGYDEILIQIRNVTLSASGIRAIRVSTDGGSTFYSTSGDYVSVPVTGAEVNNDALAFHTTATASARTLIAQIINNQSAANRLCTESGTAPWNLFTASTLPIDAIRIYGTAGNLNGGVITVWAR
jgi:Protein of unknown function (DUF2793)